MDVRNLNARYVDDDSNDTLLHKAAEKGYCEIVNELLKHHADINAHNNDGYTALMLATLQERDGIVNKLLTHQADVNAPDKDGYTALMLAALRGNHKIVKELLSQRADANIQTNNGFTALMMASSRNHNQITIELCNHDADVNLQDSAGNTALHLALLNITDITINTVKLLLSDKTNVEKVNEENKSIIQLARESQQKNILHLIEDFAEQKEIEAAKRELKKLQAKQIIKKRKKKLQEISALKDEVYDLSQKIIQVKTKNAELEEEIKKNCEKMKTWQCALKSKIENEDFKSYEKLKEDIEYFDRCMETEKFDDVVQLAKRECPVCFIEMRANKKIYQCQSGHICCEECFCRIKEGTKICPFCTVDIISNPIRCSALEEVIEEEANG